MNKRNLILIAVGLLVLPIIARALWFYQGIFHRSEAIATPDYANLELPLPPISTSQPEKISEKKGGAIVVIDHNHSNVFNTPDLAVLTGVLVNRGARLEEIGVSSFNLSDSLKYAAAYIVVAPTMAFSNEEVLQIQRFVNRGGRLLVITDPTRGQSTYVDASGMISSGGTAQDVTSANILLEPFGIAFANDYLYNLVENEGNFRNVIFSSFAKNPLTEKISKVAFYAARSLRTGGTPLIVGDSNTVSSITDSGDKLAVSALSPDGQVLAIGDLTFMTPPYNTVLDNQVLIAHIADFLLGGKRVHDLADFPYLFERAVEIFPTDKIDLKSELLTPLGTLQKKLEYLNIPLQVVEKPSPNKDLIVLGTYVLSKDLKPYVEPFDVTFSDKPADAASTPEPSDEALAGDAALTPTPTAAESPDELLPTPEAFKPVEAIGFESDATPQTVIIPGLGRFSASGTGMLLFSREGGKNRLILLADTQDNLNSLMNVLSSGDLSSCVQQGQIAICSLGSGSTYSPTFEPAPNG
jgi:hypothetical protein